MRAPRTRDQAYRVRRLRTRVRSFGTGDDMNEELHERIRAVVASVPEGTVATYGDVAALAGASTPRLVGRVLAEDGHDLPWHRVLRADGTPAPHLAREQLARLRAEGVLADGQRVDLRRFRWRPL
ncbi:putative methylated DNA-protein cysteine methyltransferase [Saccharomonospora azurea NA-128]|uniref:Methylated DNA-protein cysteine methyltransferase n=2 Tax=Saccharomonospora azurea TaxID=40988 RepID=H8G7L6_9PSEU|nr:putative methylated DNA-protein cysteine methyltransferase [Saccharomonospora azurea SZMC 14600]EHY90379.1 putative methylated DNA-protein cysteine methyltransferase [Saccharomonospora azurea NA-128]